MDSTGSPKVAGPPVTTSVGIRQVVLSIRRQSIRMIGGPTDVALHPRPAATALNRLHMEHHVMRLDVYVNYRGTCEEAFRFYERHLGGTISGLVRHADQPNPHIPPDWKDKVLHARIDLGGATLMGADIPTAEPMRSAYLSLSVDSAAEAERIYALLSDGGEVFMKLEQTHFANRFAMLRDRFGTSWMLLQN